MFLFILCIFYDVYCIEIVYFAFVFNQPVGLSNVVFTGVLVAHIYTCDFFMFQLKSDATEPFDKFDTTQIVKNVRVLSLLLGCICDTVFS